MSSSEGTHDALIFSNKHENAEDWERDLNRTSERYGPDVVIGPTVMVRHGVVKGN